MEFECKLRFIFAMIKQKDKSFTQLKFAKRVGISNATLSALVNGALPSFPTAYRIARELKKPMEEIWVLKGE